MGMGQAFRKKVKGEQLGSFFEMISRNHPLVDIVFVCIGTDRSSGDSLGPLVGSFLQEAGYDNVIGTLEHPCDASNLPARLQEVQQGKIVIAIDACLGQPSSVETFQVSDQPIEPGTSVGKKFPGVGTYSVAAIVNIDGNRKYHILQNTSLHRVIRMAKQIVSAVQHAYPIKIS